LACRSTSSRACADEQNRSALGDDVAGGGQGRGHDLDGLLEIDDMDAVPVAEQERFHLRVPLRHLVSEMGSGLKQLDQARDLRHMFFMFLLPPPNAHPPPPTLLR
jgi:hypothetical protein